MSMRSDDINNYVPSILNPRKLKKENSNYTLTQHSVVSRSSLSLNKKKTLPIISKKIHLENKENGINNLINENITASTKPIRSPPDILNTNNNFEIEDLITDSFNLRNPYNFYTENNSNIPGEPEKSCVSILSSHTELYDIIGKSVTSCDSNIQEKPILSVAFGVTDCDNINISTKNTNIINIQVAHENNNMMSVDCDLREVSHTSSESDTSNLNRNIFSHPKKRSNVAVNLEIKNKKLKTTENCIENSKVLILNSNAIEKISHVIIQPQNYKIVKQQNLLRNKIKDCTHGKSVESPAKYGKISLNSDNLKQKLLDTYLVNKNVVKVTNVRTDLSNRNGISSDERVVHDDVLDMSKTGAEGIKLETVGKISHKSNLKENDSSSPKSARISNKKQINSPKSQVIKTSKSEAPHALSPKGKNNSTVPSPKKNVDSIQLQNLTTKPKSNKSSAVTKNIPYFKIVAGTHFAVDAFSYGDIPNIKHYFLTHFHSDHYSGLKKGFNKTLFCTKITAELCISRLGVNPKCIHVMTLNQTIVVEAVEVTAVDANHCPGAIMLVFTLPNRKTILHTGDFRASPVMESYPVFWNKDIYTIYLDTTYCNPRYDFPSQDQSLEMALQILRQKKLALLKTGKKFSSVLIVCGTYTIGKEKFFLGMSQRVRCAVWACPEKERVLRAVRGEGTGGAGAGPSACQLHVLPMRDLTHEKLRSYLDSLQGAFSEVVAFKPSGWENGKSAAVEKDLVTIHGIPYSEHSSFSEIIRFVKYLKPKQVVPTVDIAGGIKAVQKYFPCPLVCKEDIQCQSKLTEYFSIQNREHTSAVT